MHQMNRKPLSHEQSMAAALLKEKEEAEADNSNSNIISNSNNDTTTTTTDQQGNELSSEELAKKQFDNDVEDWTKEQMSKNGGMYVPPTDEELLKLAGGNKMIRVMKDWNCDRFLLRG